MPIVSLFCFFFAFTGAACALLAALGKRMRFLGKTWSGRLYCMGYCLMFVSMGFFILKGFLA